MTSTLYALPDTDLVHTSSTTREYVLRVRDLPPEHKPREKLINLGPSALSMAELVAIVFMVGTQKEDVLALAHRIFAEYGEKGIVDQQNPTAVQEALDIPLAKACQLVACFELGRRLFDANTTRRRVFLRTPEQVYAYVADMRDYPKEQLRGLYLNNQYGLVHDEAISIGSLTANIIHPREVFVPALAHGASALILVHNHPSGVTTPSDADRAITDQIIAAGKILGVTLLDHLVVGRDGFESISASYDVS